MGQIALSIHSLCEQAFESLNPVSANGMADVTSSDNYQGFSALQAKELQKEKYLFSNFPIISFKEIGCFDAVYSKLCI